MSDKQNALALCCQVLHDLHQFLDLLGSEHCGRLIKDQDLIVTVKHLEDFCSLLHTNCGVFNDGVRIYRQTVFLGKLHHFFTCAVFLKKTILCGLHAKNDVVKNAEAFYQLEVLVHHTNSKVVGIIRVLDLYLFAVLADFSLFWLVQTEQNAHQGGFACSVLTKQCVDLTFF